LSELHPGGLFASTRIIYNQVHVQPGVIHPDMTEQDASGSLGLYHTYVPTSANLPVIDSLNEIQSQSLSVNVKEPKIIDSQTMSFEGAEKTLNVFGVDAMKLLKVVNMKIDVPSGSSAIIVVRGQTPAFTAMKVSGSVNAEKLLFILPDAVSFSVRGERFAGTVIATKANVNMDVRFEGSIFGGSVRSMLVNKPVMYSGCLFTQPNFKK
jgi:choice-of-anchor A domain-containing protein